MVRALPRRSAVAFLSAAGPRRDRMAETAKITAWARMRQAVPTGSPSGMRCRRPLDFGRWRWLRPARLLGGERCKGCEVQRSTSGGEAIGDLFQSRGLNDVARYDSRRYQCRLTHIVGRNCALGDWRRASTFEGRVRRSAGRQHASALFQQNAGIRQTSYERAGRASG